MEVPGEHGVGRGEESALEGGPPNLTFCLNCGSDRVEDYCPCCGQRAGSLHTSLGTFMREMLHGLFSFYSPRAWRTLIVLLHRPGHLTQEYWHGRRARYVAPLRLYLFVSSFVFLVHAIVAPENVFDSISEATDAAAGIEFDEDDPIASDDLGMEAPPPEPWFVDSVVQPIIEDPGRAGTLFIQGLPWMFFFLVPVLAAQLRILYRRHERFFIPHFIFALHFQTAVFLMYAAGITVDAISGAGAASLLAWLGIFTILFLSLRRVYRQNFLTTLVKQVGLLTVHFLVIAVAMLLLLIVTGLIT